MNVSCNCKEIITDDSNRNVVTPSIALFLHQEKSQEDTGAVSKDRDEAAESAQDDSPKVVVFDTFSGPPKDRDPSLRRAPSGTASPNSLGDESRAFEPSGPRSLQERVDDPFLFYSSDKRRLEHLLGNGLPYLLPEEPRERKTRISFEVDPFFNLVCSFPELLDEGWNDSQ